MSVFENYIDKFLKVYEEKVNQKPESGAEDHLAKFYNENSKLTLCDRKMGINNIVDQLRKEQSEFSFESYSVALVDAEHAIVTGQCLNGNKKMSFTIAFEYNPCEDDGRNVFITNQLIF